MAQEEAKWPDYFPDCCPPETALASEYTVYRLVKHNPPNDNDFIPYRISKDPTYWKNRECEACGVSVFSLIEDANKLQLLPAYKKCLIAQGRITPESGKWSYTGKHSHITWWIYDGFEAHRMFNIA
jgi:hypothetical protein